MTVRIRHITIDCADPYRLSLFWSAVTGYQEAPNDPNLPTHDQALILAPDGSAGLLFIRVPEPKSVKNRVHFDVQPLDATRDEEVERVLALGASQVDDFRRPDGTGWVVVADPEGNEFCIERSAAERAA
ncbi:MULTISPECIES: VOC family protein [Dactylosporangium]|uniref:Glyoxalase n=2 Tax=Dactylosporangium TaxID=35753 RepID=A0A9W6KXX5_9ACTN|nr:MULTISPECIES: VOC family protein [Dactylosporangium]UAB92222.1 VOC family protein [Dactylosporangium vinaceum]UWZ49065.1 VOC family protein [Dactylosporangium matsuzakiense]GLL07494.1 glyoxalase [Dactylosporangium matsuzakiense]